MSSRLLSLLIIILFVSCGKSSSAEGEAKPLPAPEPQLDGNVLRWNSIAGAVSYNLICNDQVYGLGSVPAADLGHLLGKGTFTVTLQSVGDGKLFCDSDRSREFTATVSDYSVSPRVPDDLSGISAHPRLFLLQGEEQTVLQAVGKSGNAWLNEIHNQILVAANTVFSTDPIARSWNGSMLNVAREAIRRIFALSYAYRLTGEERYAERAWLEMKSLGEFEDWNPSHYLDVAEASFAMAIGYDWCNRYLTPSQQKTIADAIYNHSLSYPVSKYSKGTNNWNPVCIGGSLCAALAIYEQYPQRCAEVIEGGIPALKRGLGCYAPDGAYPEGYTYWRYGTSYETIISDAFQSAYGLDIGLSGSTGYLRSAEYCLMCSTPTFGAFAYADSGTEQGISSALAWFAAELQSPWLMWETRRIVESKASVNNSEDRFLPLIPVRVAKGISKAVTVPAINTWFGDGDMPVFMYRSGWSSTEDVYLGVKGGCPSLSHAHMDVGMFYYEKAGVRWAADCGSQSYGAVQTMLSDSSQDGQRWELFRYGPAGHNILQFGQDNQDVTAGAEIVEYYDEPGRKGCRVDLTSIYKASASSVVREVSVNADGDLLVTDIISDVLADGILLWNMVSRSSASIISPSSVKLSSGGREAMLSCDADGASAYTVSATTGKSYDPANIGMVRTGFSLDLEKGKSYTITISLKVK